MESEKLIALWKTVDEIFRIGVMIMVGIGTFLVVQQRVVDLERRVAIVEGREEEHRWMESVDTRISHIEQILMENKR